MIYLAHQDQTRLRKNFKKKRQHILGSATKFEHLKKEKIRFIIILDCSGFGAVKFISIRSFQFRKI
ncbi:hypothetical protein BpHYR1_004955 [Brachionus plicatilis]|uniref:Uncharacterized protein n=1 Tax=Brachionus plicatilis TaxID=10195 RepID=A0A3M7RJB6_BRAPC|nr:hypothetical protein BpHYR1_004955 [Brachionus plicatilis]